MENPALGVYIPASVLLLPVIHSCGMSFSEHLELLIGEHPGVHTGLAVAAQAWSFGGPYVHEHRRSSLTHHINSLGFRDPHLR